MFSHHLCSFSDPHSVQLCDANKLDDVMKQGPCDEMARTSPDRVVREGLSEEVIFVWGRLGVEHIKTRGRT